MLADGRDAPCSFFCNVYLNKCHARSQNYEKEARPCVVHGACVLSLRGPRDSRARGPRVLEYAMSVRQRRSPALQTVCVTCVQSQASSSIIEARVPRCRVTDKEEVRPCKPSVRTVRTVCGGLFHLFCYVAVLDLLWKLHA